MPSHQRNITRFRSIPVSITQPRSPIPHLYTLQSHGMNSIRRSVVIPPLCRPTARFSSRMSRPSPPPLPREQQREFEELLRFAQGPFSGTTSQEESEADLALHPDARPPLSPDFEGDVNPDTGEQGGPKKEPFKRWVQGEGDWSSKGRVSDF